MGQEIGLPNQRISSVDTLQMKHNTLQTIIDWAKRFGAPPLFYAKALPFQRCFGVLGVLLLIVGSLWGLGFAPEDYQQGNSFRIIFIHVPASFLAQSCYMLMGIAALLVLVWRMKLADVCIDCAARLGVGFTLISLITGTIWGKPTWGAWWVSDARTLSMVVLLFLYLGVIALKRALDGQRSAERAAAMLVVVGLVNLPIIRYSVDWWLTLHQPATFTLTAAPSMPSSMWLPLLLNVIGLYALFGWLLLRSMRVDVRMRHYGADWTL